MQLRKLSNGLRIAFSGSDVHNRVKRYDGWIDRDDDERDGPGYYNHAETVKEYYDLSNEFMVYGWGESLHFAPISPGERLEDSKIRHQRLMIERLELRDGMVVIDVGCGVGGPMRRVLREANVRVVGVNNNDLQLEKAKSLNAEAGLGHMVDYLSGSFMDMGALTDDTFDRGYAIESTCHAPDKAGAFAEIYRVLKPGALFWGQEMCLTGKFDPRNDRHQVLKEDLRRGIALRNIATMGEVDGALEATGVPDYRSQGPGCWGGQRDHSVVQAHGRPGRPRGQRTAQDPRGPQGPHRGFQSCRDPWFVPERVHGRPFHVGSYRQGLRRSWQGRNFHSPVLLPGPKALLGLRSCMRGVVKKGG